MATTQTNAGKGPAKAQAALAAKAKAAAEKGEKKEKPQMPVPVLKKSALSTDVGPAVIRGLAQAAQDEAKAEEVLQQVGEKRYDLLSSLLLAVVKAAKADDSIDLKASVMTGPDANKAQQFLNDQIGVALGFKSVVEVKKKDGTALKVVRYSDSVAAFFPQPGDRLPDGKGLTPEGQRRHTFRGNFLTQLKKVEQAALGVIERNIQAKMDKKAGTLLLSGPSIKQQFGASEVLLNEKQTQGEGKKEMKLQQRPSFQAIANKAKEAHGGVSVARSNTRGDVVIDTDKALASLAKSVVSVCEKLKQPNDTQIEHLEAMASAIEKVLNG